jgi:hypothetical protein
VRSLVVAAGISLAAGAQAQTTIDFSAVPNGNLPSYSEAGVVFTAVGGGDVTGSGFGVTPNGTRGLIGASIPFAELTALLPGPASMVSIDLGDFNADGDLIFLEIFDSSNTSLGYVDQLLSANFSGMQTLTLSASNIARAQYGSRSPSVDGSSIYTDNFKFQLARGGNVPEPASLSLLLAGGLPFIAVAYRRRRANKA